MLKNIKINIANPLFKGSLIVFVGSLAAGLGNYFFNILMGRMLGPAEYGVLASLLSLIYIISVPSQTIHLVASKYTADAQAKDMADKIWAFLMNFSKKAVYWGLILFTVFLISSFFIKEFLQLPSLFPLAILGIILLVSLIQPIGTGGLIGLENFKDIAINNILMIIAKLSLGVLLVYLGWGAEGALLAILLSALLAAFHAFFQLHKLPKSKGSLGIDIKKFIKYSRGVFLASFCLIALFNIDVVLVKHFLSPTEAGFYAALSLLGKMIFFFTASIGTVLFPFSAKNKVKNLDNFYILKISIAFTIILSTLISLVYLIFPELIVMVLLGEPYIPIVNYLGWIGIIFAFYSLINTLAMFSLSVGKTDFTYTLLLGTVAQAVLLLFFHQNLWQVIYVMAGVMSSTALSLTAFLYIQGFFKSRAYVHS